MRVALIIPTSEGPASILRLTRLAKAPRSVLRTQDDYRPLPPSSRYHAFIQPGGPLADRINLPSGQFELRLGAVVETGRSWELPVALAHWLDAGGHDLVSGVADLVVWATGALDNDLRVLSQDYHLATKLDRSSDLLVGWLEQGVSVLALVPDAVSLPQHLQNRLLTVHRVADLSEAIHVIGVTLEPDAGKDIRPDIGDDGPASRARVWFVAGAVFLLVVLLWFAVRSMTAVGPLAPVAGVASDDTSVGIAIAAVSQEPAEAGRAPPYPAGAGNDASPLQAEVVDRTAQQAPGADIRPNVLPRLITAHAPRGTTCRSVLFGSDVPEHIERQASEAGYGIVTSHNNLCSFGFVLPESASAPVQITLPDRLGAHILPSDRRDGITLQPGETRLFRLRAELPAEIDAEFFVAVTGSQAVRLRLILQDQR